MTKKLSWTVIVPGENPRYYEHRDDFSVRGLPTGSKVIEHYDNGSTEYVVGLHMPFLPKENDRSRLIRLRTLSPDADAPLTDGGFHE